MDTAAILRQFDEAADEAVFVDLANGYYYPIDSRLHAFHDVGRWALVVELVGYSPRPRALIDVLHIFGNCLTSGEIGFGNDDFLSRAENLNEVVDQSDASLVISRKRVPLTSVRGEPMVDALRRLAPAHRELLLAGDDELRGRIPADIPEVLRLDEWHQPVFDDLLPSETETYQLVAEVLATGDPTRYRPTLPPNTHWSHWPDAGTL